MLALIQKHILYNCFKTRQQYITQQTILNINILPLFVLEDPSVALYE